ncbi:MAG TPA: hypothetical protein VF183_11965, partial [Acidimicrobiales bacterium]
MPIMLRPGARRHGFRGIRRRVTAAGHHGTRGLARIHATVDACSCTVCQTGRRLWWVLAGFAAGVVVTALVAWLWLRSDSADPVDVADVVERYRASTTNAPTPIVDASVTPGVYVYRTSGSERVDALGGSTHDYPEQTTITVTHDEPCARLRWDALSQR